MRRFVIGGVQLTAAAVLLSVCAVSALLPTHVRAQGAPPSDEEPPPAEGETPPTEGEAPPAEEGSPDGGVAGAEEGEAPAAGTEPAAPSELDEGEDKLAPPADADRTQGGETEELLGEPLGGAIEELDLEALLNEPVVTASGGQAEERSVAAANVVEIRREQIEANGWMSVAEALASVPGLYLIDDLVRNHVSVRGISGGLNGGTRIIKVMINSMPIAFRSNLHAWIGPEFIPISAVERIEVAKGPLSALYGANAFLATINIITKKPQDGTHGLVAGHVRFVQTDGRTPSVVAPGVDPSMLEPDDTFSRGLGAEILVTQKEGPWAALAAFAGETQDRSGLHVTKTFDGQSPDLIPTFRPFFSDQSRRDRDAPLSGYGLLRYTSESYGTFTLQGGWQHKDAVGEFQPASVLTHRSRYVLSNGWTGLQYEHKPIEKLYVRGTLGYSQGEPTRTEELLRTGNLQSSFFRNFGYKAIDTSAAVSYLPLKDFSLSVGYEGSFEDHDILFFTQRFNQGSGSRPSGSTQDLIGAEEDRSQKVRTVGTFVNVRGAPIKSVPDLRFAANLRLDFPNLFNTQFSWRAAVAYSFRPELVTKLIIGEAYQVPSVDLLFARQGFGNSNNLLGSRAPGSSVPALDPQRVLSGELVVVSRILKLVGIEGAVFVQKLRDQIEFVPQAQNFVARNSGGLSNVGFELSGRLNHERIGAALSTTALWTKRSDDNSFSTQAPELYPQHMTRAEVTLKVPEAYLNVLLAGRLVGPRGSSSANAQLNNRVPYELDTYGLVDLVLTSTGLSLFEGERETKLSFGLYNVFDDRTPEPGFGGYDLPRLGRTLFFRVQQDF